MISNPIRDDPLLDFIVQQPTNQASANINGVELNWVHFFTGNLNGFGFQVNATVVDGDISYDVYRQPERPRNSLPLYGLVGLVESHGAFYENEQIQCAFALQQPR